MNYPKYLVNITYVNEYPYGTRQVSVNGSTTSIPNYAGGYYLASMPRLDLFATGSTYEASLATLLAAATASNNGLSGY